VRGRGHEEIKLRVLRVPSAPLRTGFVVNKRLSAARSRSAVDVDNLGWRKTVERGGCRSAIGADVSAVEEIVTLQIDGSSSVIEITSSPSQVGPNTVQIWVRPFLKASK